MNELEIDPFDLDETGESRDFEEASEPFDFRDDTDATDEVSNDDDL